MTLSILHRKAACLCCNEDCNEVCLQCMLLTDWVLQRLSNTQSLQLVNAYMVGCLVCFQTCLPFSLVVTLVTCVSNTFMFGLLVCTQTSLLRSFIVTLVTDVSNTFMFGLLMFPQTNRMCSPVFTLVTCVYNTFKQVYNLFQSVTKYLMHNR